MQQQEPASRILALEEQLAFQQRTIDQLSEVLRDYQDRTDRLQLLVHKLQGELTSLREQQSEDLPHEKPPHY